MPAVPGALTPTELMTAWNAGAAVVGLGSWLTGCPEGVAPRARALRWALAPEREPA